MPELELDLALPEKDWPELMLALGQVSMLEPQLSSILEHVKKWEPTIKDDQMSEMGTRMELWPILKSKLMQMEKLQLAPKKEVQEPVKQQVPALESHWSTELGQRPKQAKGQRWGW